MSRTSATRPPRNIQTTGKRQETATTFQRENSMTRYLVLVLLTAMTALGTEGTPSSSVPSDQATLVTFNKDVLPILENNCQTCHRPGGIGPMSLLTYESARPWAKAIKSAVVS